ncbi:MAG: hypothetical protein R2834_06875 [Rhodothermales bacterium]
MPRHLLPRLLLNICLLQAGCNAFAPFQDEGGSDAIADLLVDARIALDTGDTAAAVSYMERALPRSGDRLDVRTLLSEALVQRDTIRLFDVVSLSRTIGFDDGAEKEPFIPAGAAPACSFSPSAIPSSPLSLIDEPAYAALEPRLQVMRRIKSLLDVPMPANDGPETTLLLARAYQIRALVHLSLALVEVQKTAEATTATLHRLPSGGIGYCADSQEEMSMMTAYVACRTADDLDEAATSATARAQLFESPRGTTSDTLIDAANSAWAALGNEIAETCPTR